MKKLPTKRSELLRLAVRDAQLVEKDPRYKLIMCEWHYWNPNKKVCTVCLAGSVIAKTLKKSIKLNLMPDDFDEDTRNALNIIDNMREGFIANDSQDQDQCEMIDRVQELISNNIRNNGRAPWKTYLKAADMLEQVGL